MALLKVSKVAGFLSISHGASWPITRVRFSSCVFVLMFRAVYFLRESHGAVVTFKPFNHQVGSIEVSTKPITGLKTFVATLN